jgi:uncharacterized protein YkwD
VFNTQEGKNAYINAINFLKAQRSLPPFAWSDKLASAARDHCEDAGPKGMVSNVGSDGSTPDIRISRHGRIDETWSETSIFGALNTKEVLERIIVCDGQPQRGFRKSMFSSDFKVCGLSTSSHAKQQTMV